jgi:gas vesicle protein
MEHNKKGNMGAFLSGVFVATAVGGYLLFGSKNAKKNRQKVEDWVEDAKADVVSRLKKIKRLSRDKYYEIVDDVSGKNSKMKDVGKEKADELRDELKRRWEEIEEEAREEEDEE